MLYCCCMGGAALRLHAIADHVQDRYAPGLPSQRQIITATHGQDQVRVSRSCCSSQSNSILRQGASLWSHGDQPLTHQNERSQTHQLMVAQITGLRTCQTPACEGRSSAPCLRTWTFPAHPSNCHDNTALEHGSNFPPAWRPSGSSSSRRTTLMW